MEPFAEGTIVAGRYELIRKRGTGGVGSVWLARDLTLESLCAIKLIDCQRANDHELCVRLEREAKSAAQIRGTHVVDIFDHGIWNGIPFIVMEYLEGEDLGERLARIGRLNPEETYRIVAQVARALARAHGAGIVHRDLKPDNIFLVAGDEHEIAKVLDFGIARHEEYSKVTKTTKTGTFVGTPTYVSPEQARGKDIDWRSDLWALGIIVFECLTGRPPFVSEAWGELMGMILYEPILPMTEHDPELPKAIDVWWRRASERDPELRFQSAKQLVDALADALGIESRLQIPDILPYGLRARGISSLPDVPVARATPIEPASVRNGSGIGNSYTSVPPRPQRRRLRHESWILTLGTVAVCSVGAISTISSIRGQDFAPTVPALLRVMPATTLPAPALGSELAQAPLEVSPPEADHESTAAEVEALPTRATVPRQTPARSMKLAPRRSKERGARELREDTVPDYGI